MNTKVSSIISVCTVLNVNTDVMLENANTRKIYAVSRGDITTTDTRYFLSSVTDVERFAYAVRKHWCLDAIFNEDASKACKDMSPLNLNILRKTALALCKNADFGRRFSIQKKRFAAALNPQRLLDILLG